MEPLFTTETAYTLDEFKKFDFRVMRKSIISIYIMLAAIILLDAVLALLKKDWAGINTAIIIAVAFIAVYFPFSLDKKVKDTYNSNKTITKTVAKIEFFEDGFTEATDHSTYNFKYSDLNSVIETQTNFYLMIAKNQGVIIVKENCSAELIEFVQKLKNDK